MIKTGRMNMKDKGSGVGMWGGPTDLKSPVLFKELKGAYIDWSM